MQQKNKDESCPFFDVRMAMQGTSLWARYSASFGYLNKQGYCTGSNVLGSPSGDCHLFPVILGETGTGFTASALLRWPGCQTSVAI